MKRLSKKKVVGIALGIAVLIILIMLCVSACSSHAGSVPESDSKSSVVSEVESSKMESRKEEKPAVKPTAKPTSAPDKGDVDTRNPTTRASLLGTSVTHSFFILPILQISHMPTSYPLISGVSTHILSPQKSDLFYFVTVVCFSFQLVKHLPKKR